MNNGVIHKGVPGKEEGYPGEIRVIQYKGVYYLAVRTDDGWKYIPLTQTQP